MGNSFLYSHTRSDKNEIFYIGIGTHSKKGNKYNRAFSKTRSSIWKSIVAKTNYTVSIVFDNLSWDDACLKEIELISFYGRKWNKTGILANITTGGDGSPGRVNSEETKNKIRLKAIGKVILPSQRDIARSNALGNKNCVGYKHSDEFKEKCRKAQTGKKMTENAKNKIGIFWKGKPKPEDVKQKISNTLKGRIISEDAKKKISDKLKKNSEFRVDKYDKNNLYICSFDNAELAAKSVMRSPQSIKKSISANNGRLVGGFIFKRAS